DLAGANLLAGPEDADARVERGGERLEIARWARSEDPVEQRVVAVVARADRDPRRPAAFGGELHDRGLATGEVVRAAVHVVEQDREFRRPGGVEFGDLVGKRRALLHAERQVGAEGREPDAQAHALGGAMPGEIRQFLRVGEGRAPVAPQARVGLGGVEIEAVAAGRQGGHGGAARAPRPGSAEESLDDAEFGLHAMSWRGSVPANYRPRPVRRGPSDRIDTLCAPPWWRLPLQMRPGQPASGVNWRTMK